MSQPGYSDAGESNVPPKKEKIAVLGGGAGALSAVYALTKEPDWADKYDITVYQLGWRLGGKGASGRDQANGQRILEHGLHIWFGCYDNAFDLMRHCYDELHRSSDAPLATWDTAFKPHSFVVTEDTDKTFWENWAIDFPPRPGLPGDPHAYRPPWEYIEELARWIVINFARLPKAWTNVPPGEIEFNWQEPEWLKQVINHIPGLDKISLGAADQVLQKAHELVENIENSAVELNSLGLFAISWLFKTFRALLRHTMGEAHELGDEERRIKTLIELATIAIHGIIDDDVVRKGFEVINQYELREWFGRHGAEPDLLCSTALRGFYDVSFAYPDGDTGSTDPTCKGNIAAGTALYIFMRMTFDYKGSLMWKMQAGMGDVVFAPLYQVLKQRKVKFKFFHKVKNLVPDPVTREISQIQISRQVDLKSEVAEYDPLIEVKDLPCWPSEPRYEQIKDGDKLKGYNLESFWTDWQDVEPDLVLKQGEDFDKVVLGISLGALPYICPALIELDPDWKAMVENVKTVRTQAFQLWLNQPLDKLGWPLSSPVIAGYIQPFNTWADMSQTLSREDWPEGLTPQNVAYFCGQMKEDDAPQPVPPAPDFAEAKAKQVQETAQLWLNRSIAHLWPKAVTTEGQLNTEWLIAPADTTDPLAAQFFRANVDPSERYVLAVAGSSSYRLHPGKSGFSNLYLAGDWTWNLYNVGAVESAVVSGLLASQAISGHPKEILAFPASGSI
jgi:uncharacterized protein with NAD-binding domain and iron-sulfur cluster